MATKAHREKAADPSDELKKQLDLVLGIALRVWRRRLLILAVVPLAVVGFLVGPRLMPPKYASEAVLLYRSVLRSETVLGSDSVVDESSRSRGQRLCSSLWSASTLEQIILGENLYAGTRERLGMRDAVIALREDGSCDLGEADTIRIMFEGPDPDLVFRVTSSLANTLIEIASREGVEQAQKTLLFLEAEERQIAAVLRKKEQEHAEFLHQHPEFLNEPGSNRSGTASAIANPSSTVITLRRQADRLRRQLATAAASAEPQESAPAPPPERELTPESRQAIARAESTLVQARENLSRVRERFTPQHPDVIAAQNSVARAISDVAREKAAAQYVDPPARTSPTPAGPSSADRVRMRAQLNQIERAMQRAVGGGDEPSNQVEQLASLEARWHQLTRELETARSRHEQVASRLFRALILVKATNSGEGSPLVMVDQPYRPGRPSSMGPRRTALMGAAALSFFGFLAIVGLALLDDRIYTAGEVERLSLGKIVHTQRRARG